MSDLREAAQMALAVLVELNLEGFVLADHADPMVDAIEALRAALAEAEPNPWKHEVIEALVISHIYQAAHEDDPRKALADLIAWETQIALDPAVSSEAQALIDKGRAEAEPEKVAPVVDFSALLKEAEAIVTQKPVWKQFVDGTPLSNDVPVWMAVFAQDHLRRAQPPAPQPGIKQPPDLEPILDRYIGAYVFCADEGDYTPTERERMLIKDAFLGLLIDGEWDAAWGLALRESYRPDLDAQPGIKWVAMTEAVHRNMQLVAMGFRVTVQEERELLEVLGTFPDADAKQEPT